ncbi:MAG: RNA polymerase sigma factor [Endomicrobiia bacterium]|jgi:RNA polymerase sigma-70 factor (ECF subfamily)|nr:RNA polymerase sigma factor [Endomicrobiaceae bacterium]MDD3922098.1 RNA polymerase sigma factor [Endomicrobiaceae bacterium]
MNDKEIIEKILAGQENLFRHIIDRYKDKVFSIIFSFCGYTSDCEDIVQSVFIKIFYSLKKFKFESSFSTWMYRIVINESINFAKKRNNKIISLQEKISSDDDQEIIDFIKSDDNIEKKAIEQETQKLVQNTLIKLKNNYKIVLTLRDIENFSYEEISQMMNVSVDTVKIWLFRARKKMREILIQGDQLL